VHPWSEELCCRPDGDTADSEIARRVALALRSELPLCWQQIRPVVRDGSVTLEGSLEWIHQRAEAEVIVRGVRGVVRVVNSIALAAHP
jgi:osmotically-inducible protein OsmY